jgi:uncharacterized protein (TIGR03000 family)
MEMTTNVNVRTSRIACYLCALASVLSANQISSAQCCGGIAMGGYSSDMMGYSLTPGQTIEGDSVYLTVSLPEAAVLQINGDPTISLGATRYFVVRGLDSAKTYTFEIVAETLNPAGVALIEKKTLKLRPGANEIVVLKPVKRKVARPRADAPKADDDKDASAEENNAKAEEVSAERKDATYKKMDADSKYSGQKKA